jgi:hypothetical protein
MRHGDRLAIAHTSHVGHEWLESDNEYGIPILDPAMQAVELPTSWRKWGEQCRKTPHPTLGVHCYTEDYKFAGLWSHDWISQGGYAVAVEPNFSTGPGMPLAVVLWGIYRKRHLARRWQREGIRILVDLNTEAEFADVALLGVPQGWRAYATRARDGHREEIEMDFERGCERAGSSDILYVVFGGHSATTGGERTAELCADRGWTHIPERAEEVANGKR